MFRVSGFEKSAETQCFVFPEIGPETPSGVDDSLLPSVRALDFRRSATQAAVLEQTKNRHDRSSLRRSARSFGAVEQTYPVADHA